MPRFIVKHVPVPAGGHIVADTFALPVRLHAGGVLYNRYERHQPHSAYYADAADAQAVADWLTERAAGYPYNPLMAEPATYTAASAAEVCEMAQRQVVPWRTRDWWRETSDRESYRHPHTIDRLDRVELAHINAVGVKRW